MCTLVAMSETAFILLFDLFGTMVFAITGAVKGVRIRLDLLGVLVFAVTVGCGGGMVRDMLLEQLLLQPFNLGIM